MKALRLLAIVIALGGVVLAAFSAYLYMSNEDEARANRYAAEQEKVLADASRAKGTPKEQELMKEYEEGKGVAELARNNARQTRQTATLMFAGGVVLLAISLLALFVTRKKLAVAQ